MHVYGMTITEDVKVITTTVGDKDHSKTVDVDTNGHFQDIQSHLASSPPVPSAGEYTLATQTYTATMNGRNYAVGEYLIVHAGSQVTVLDNSGGKAYQSYMREIYLQNNNRDR